MSNRKSKQIPQRICIVCRQKSDKRHLLRLVRTPQGVMIDPTGKQQGRGAYVCDNPDCRQRVASTAILNKALKTILTDEDRQRLRDIAS